MKLKLDLSYVALAVFFNISSNLCSSYFKETLSVLSIVLGSAVVFLSKDEIASCLPKCFGKYQSVRIVLDCTEVPVEKPKCLKCRIRTYSHYKSQHTVKVLIGVAPSGVITFVSKPFGGRASDKVITEQTGVLEKCLPFVDSVMVDKGFAIEDLCFKLGLNLVRPTFLRDKKQFSQQEAHNSAAIARARVHVERAIGRMKFFKVLQNKIPWDLLPFINEIFQTVAGIVNLSNPILDEARF